MRGPSLELTAVLARLAAVADDLSMNGLFQAADKMGDVIRLAHAEAAALKRPVNPCRRH